MGLRSPCKLERLRRVVRFGLMGSPSSEPLWEPKITKFSGSSRTSMAMLLHLAHFGRTSTRLRSLWVAFAYWRFFFLGLGPKEPQSTQWGWRLWDNWLHGGPCGWFQPCWRHGMSWMVGNQKEDWPSIRVGNCERTILYRHTGIDVEVCEKGSESWVQLCQDYYTEGIPDLCVPAERLRGDPNNELNSNEISACRAALGALPWAATQPLADRTHCGQNDPSCEGDPRLDQGGQKQPDHLEALAHARSSTLARCCDCHLGRPSSQQQTSRRIY